MSRGPRFQTTIWTMAADGGDARPLATMPYVESLDWRSDGTSLLVDVGGQRPGAYLVDAVSGAAELVGPGAKLPAWSHDGAQVYYFEDELEATRDWRFRVRHIEDGRLVPDGDVPTGGTDLMPHDYDVAPCG